MDYHQQSWEPGQIAFFEYHCLESHDSADTELGYRSHSTVTVSGRDHDEQMETHGWNYQQRCEEGMPNVYAVRFPDGYQDTVFEDELMTSSDGFYRPDPPRSRCSKPRHTLLTHDLAGPHAVGMEGRMHSTSGGRS